MVIIFFQAFEKVCKNMATYWNRGYLLYNDDVLPFALLFFAAIPGISSANADMMALPMPTYL